MPKVMHLYLDDTGTRHPDKKPGNLPAHGRDWFGLGGVLVKEEDEEDIRVLHAEFMQKWDMDVENAFLHSSDIRGKTGHFTWLAALETVRFHEFMNDLYGLMAQPPFLGFACVIDRPGYDARYLEKYGRQRWSLCKTAFAIVVERAAKYAAEQGYKLRVFVERSDKKVDAWMKGYYTHLRTEGMPFSANGMEKYAPLTADQLQNVLYEFRTKNKSSPIMQIADLYLWPMAIGGYDKNNRTYKRLKQDAKIIDCFLTEEQLPHLGVKYSCFELVKGNT